MTGSSENHSPGKPAKLEGLMQETAQFREAATKPLNEKTYAHHLKNAQAALKYLEGKIEEIREQGATKNLAETTHLMIHLDQMLEHLEDGVEQLSESPATAQEVVNFLQQFGV